MNTQELKQKFKEIFANSELKNASEEAQDKFIDGLIDSYMKLFMTNIAEELTDEQGEHIDSLNTAEEVNDFLESLDLDLESIAADSAYTIIQIAQDNLIEAKAFVEGVNFNKDQ